MEVLLKTLVSTIKILNKSNLHITKSKLAIILIAIFSILFIYLIKWNGLSGQNYRNTIKSDGIGYYQYIAEILEGDLSQQKINGTFLLKTNNDRVVNKYTIGTAIMVSPFILPVYILQKISGTSIDLYSEYYQKAYSIAALFYLIIGLIAFRKLLILYNTEAKVITFSLFAIFAGTNLAYYSLIEPSMSHIYSFSLISIFMLKIKESTFKFTRQNIFLLAIILGLIVLVRPLNIIIVLIIPFIIFDNYKAVVTQLKANLKNILIALVIFAAIISLQLFVWHIQTDQFLLWSYSNEGFYFSQPEILNFLFSLRKGAFVYTPLVLLSTIVFFFSQKFKIRFKLSALFFYTILIYILSSWWNWYYGDSFGMRPMIDYYSLLFLVIAIFYTKINKLLKVFTMTIIAICIFLNLFQTYQYSAGIIHPDSMNRVNYNYVFLKTGSQYKNIIGNKVESFYGKLSGSPVLKAGNDMENQYSDWNIMNESYSKNSFEGTWAYQLDSLNRYSPAYILPINELSAEWNKKNSYVVFRTKYFEPYQNATFNSMFVLSIIDEDKQVAYESFNFKSLPDSIFGIWRNEQVGFRIPETGDNSGVMKFYIWNKEGDHFLLDEIEILIYNIITD